MSVRGAGLHGSEDTMRGIGAVFVTHPVAAGRKHREICGGRRDLGRRAGSEPGLDADPDQLAAIECPVMVLRSSASVIHHSCETSEALAAMIPGFRLVEPPWGPKEWNDGFREPDNSRRFYSFEKRAPMVIECAGTL